MEVSREWLTLLFFISCFTQEAYTQGFTSSPENVFICEPDSLPPSFSLTCGYEGFTVFPQWNVTGLSMHSDVLVTRDQPSVEFLSYTQATAAEATLDVSMNVAVSEGTCFQCTVDIIGGRVSSEKGCVTSVELIPCVTNVTVLDRMDNALAFMWTDTMSERYEVTVCPCGTPCQPLSGVGNRTNTVVSGLTPGTCYVIQVESVNRNCMARGCTNNAINTTTTGAPPTAPPPPPPPPELWLLLLILVPVVGLPSVTIFCIVVYKKKKGATHIRATELTEYTDPKAVRDKKEETKKDELVYVTPTFSKQNEDIVKKPKRDGNVEYAGVQLA